MPIRLADIYKDIKTVTFAYDGQGVTVEYRHKKLTPVNRVALMGGSEFFIERKTSGDDGEIITTWQDVREGNDQFYALLADMLVGWDVLDDEGQPLPVTVEWLGQLPQDFLSALIKAIFSDGRPDPTKGESSPDT